MRSTGTSATGVTAAPRPVTDEQVDTERASNRSESESPGVRPALSTTAWATPLWLPGYQQAMARTHGVAAAPEGTTLERSIITTGEGSHWPEQRLIEVHSRYFEGESEVSTENDDRLVAISHHRAASVQPGPWPGPRRPSRAAFQR